MHVLVSVDSLAMQHSYAYQHANEKALHITKACWAFVRRCASVGTGCLSCWQLQRRQWKLALVDERSARLQAAPVSLGSLLPASAALLPEALEFRQVELFGVFEHEKQILLGPRSAPPSSGGSATVPTGAPTQSGWDVITPMVCSDGRRVLVNRGWVARDQVDRLSLPAGEVGVIGVLRAGEAGNRYARNDVANGRFVWLDLDALAEATSSSPILVFSQKDALEAKPNAWPLPRPHASFVDFYVQPTTHLVYAATWASLSVAGACLTYMRFVR